MSKYTDKDLWTALAAIPDAAFYLPAVFRTVRSAQAIWNMSERSLSRIKGLSAKGVGVITQGRRRVDPVRERERIESGGVRVMTLDDDDYPQLLREIEFPPPILFTKGELVTKYREAVAIVGSRNCNAYGRAVAESLARALSGAGLTVISGLARGIDQRAHIGSVDSGGGTIAVLGCGIDVAYPPEARGLQDKIAKLGSLVSQFTLGTRPLAVHFPMRNELISGLARGVIVVQAGEKSGALITADAALRQGREVMAVPGDVRNSLSRGAHQLILDGGRLVDNPENVLETLGLTRLKITMEETVGVSDEERRLLKAMGLGDSRSIDELAGRLSVAARCVSVTLTMLEIKGLVRRDGFGRYFRVK